MNRAELVAALGATFFASWCVAVAITSTGAAIVDAIRARGVVDFDEADCDQDVVA